MRETFQVLVGKQLFVLHTNVFVPRSRWLTAKHQHPEWEKDVVKPVDLGDQDPNVFEAYMQCAYSGDPALYERLTDFSDQIRAWGTRLEFTNIPKDIDRDEFSDFLKSIGEIKQLNIRSKGRGYVDFVHAEDCTTAKKGAMRFQGTLLEKQIKLDIALSNAGEKGQRLAQIVYEDMIELYILVTKLQDARTLNQIMEALLEFFLLHNALPRPAAVQTAYRCTEKGDALRTFLRDAWVSQLPDKIDDLTENENNFPKAFIEDVLKEIVVPKAENEKARVFEDDSRCENYHQHNVFYHPIEDCEFLDWSK